MQQSAGTVPSDGDSLDRAADGQSHLARPGRGTPKFVYASGSRPLDGFTIKRGIGIGGFGEVYYATSDAGKDVALKHIQRNLDVELRGVKQCLNLKHHNLVALYDIKYDPDDRAWVVMEYVAGESLQDVIDRNPNGMPGDQATIWLQGIATGLGYLHDHGIVHRDLKPGNIFLDDDVVKIGDYGLSKFISCSRRSGQTESVGTFHYMAPEIGRGRYGKEIDIYALGIILYEMLTGSVPFDGESSQEIIMKHLTAQPSLERIPPAFRPAIAKALAKDPERRTSSAQEMTSAMPAVSVSASIDHDSPSPVRTAEIVDDRGPGDARPTEAPYADPVDWPAGPDGGRPLPEEPIARAVCDLGIRMRRGWYNAKPNNLPRFVILLIVVFALAFNLGWIVPVGIALVPVGITAGMVYLAYLLIRAIFVDTGGVPVTAAPGPAPTSPPTPAPEAPKKPARKVPHRRRPWQVLARQELQAKSPRERLAELIGSMLMAVIVCAVLCLAMIILATVLFAGQTLDASLLTRGSLYTWMTLTSIVGVWGILVPSKLWEGSRNEPALRRFTMLAVGLLVGAVSCVLAQGLQVEHEYLLGRSFHTYPTALYEAGGIPNVWGCLGHFAGLFVVLRWWKQADPLRSMRLSLFTTFICVLWAAILYLYFPFPRGFLVAATISIAVQLSSPWMSSGDRKRLRRAAQEV